MMVKKNPEFQHSVLLIHSLNLLAEVYMLANSFWNELLFFERVVHAIVSQPFENRCLAYINKITRGCLD